MIPLTNEQVDRLESRIAALEAERDRLKERVEWFETSGGLAAHIKVFDLMAELGRLKAKLDNYEACKNIKQEITK